MNEDSKSHTNKRISMAFCILLYIIIAGMIVYVSVTQMNFLIAGREFSTGSISGVLTVVNIVIATRLVMAFGAFGFRIGIILLCIQLVQMVYTIIYKGSIEPIPGIAMVLGGIVILHILFAYIKKLGKSEDELYMLAYTDPLTGISNRRAFYKYIKQLIEKKPEEEFAVVFMDIDNFKGINDSMGHKYGDCVLIEFVHRWQQRQRLNEYFARLGGDEFASVILNYGSREDLISMLEERMYSLDERFAIEKYDFYISASFGVALYPDDSVEYETLLRYADTAMYQAKRDGKGRIALFDRVMEDKVLKEVEIENALREALDNNGFYLVYQPQFDIHTERIKGFEVLLRMKNKNGEDISPGTFIPIAEKSDLIIKITHWVLDKAFDEFKDVAIKYGYILSVNISVVHFLDRDFLKDIITAIEKHSFNPSLLELEITESVLIPSVEQASILLKQLKRYGIHIALDDFGTGYASLSYLTKLPIDDLKIDKLFIDNIADDKRQSDFIAAIISLGYFMHFKIIAEGVETKMQLEVLRDLACDYLQGYLWGKPMTIDETKLVCTKESEEFSSE